MGFEERVHWPHGDSPQPKTQLPLQGPQKLSAEQWAAADGLARSSGCGPQAERTPSFLGEEAGTRRGLFQSAAHQLCNLGWVTPPV